MHGDPVRTPKQPAPIQTVNTQTKAATPTAGMKTTNPAQPSYMAQTRGGIDRPTDGTTSSADGHRRIECAGITLQSKFPPPLRPTRPIAKSAPCCSMLQKHRNAPPAIPGAAPRQNMEQLPGSEMNDTEQSTDVPATRSGARRAFLWPSTPYALPLPKALRSPGIKGSY